MGKMHIRPSTLREAAAFVAQHHRHSAPPKGHRWSIKAVHHDLTVAVAVVGRPLARMLDEEGVAEVLRVCAAPDAPKGVNSMLYAACWRAWREMGGTKMLTYTLQEESGASLRALKQQGWRRAAAVRPHSKGWDRGDRPQVADPIYQAPKVRWEVE